MPIQKPNMEPALRNPPYELKALAQDHAKNPGSDLVHPAPEPINTFIFPSLS